MRVLVVAAAALALPASLAGSAVAMFTPAWTHVPARLRAELAAESGGPLYLPARTPRFYRYRSGAAMRSGVLSLRFVNRVRVRRGVWRWTKQSFLWQVSPLPASTGCRVWANRQTTLQVDGNRVYWTADTGGGTAWRCVTDRGGHRRVLAASNGGALPDVALAIVVASGLDVSDRR